MIDYDRVLSLIRPWYAGTYNNAARYTLNFTYTVRGKMLEWEKIGEFGESWALRQYFTRQLFLFRIFQLG